MLMKYFMEKFIEDIRPQWDKKRCLHFKYRKEQCTLCQERCPHGAITLGNGRVEIDQATCKGCGACLGQCPTQALQMKGYEPLKMVRTATDQPAVVIGCTQGKNQGNVTVPCIEGIHAENYANLLLYCGNKDMKVNMIHCQGCSHHKAPSKTVHAIEKAQNFTTALGKQGRIQLVADPKAVVKLPQREMSRREFFNFFRREGMFVAEKALDEATANLKENLSIIAEVPATNQQGYDRSLFLSALKALPKNVSGPMPEGSLIANWGVEDGCNGCGYCEGICPQSAWKVNRTPVEIVISHQQKRCVACGVCHKTCPKKAIVPESLSLENLEKEVIKKRLFVIQCSQCHQRFVSPREVSCCPKCSESSAAAQGIENPGLQKLAQ